MNEKTMTDVADKAVDKIASGVESVARAVEKVAPHVWEVLVRQARNEGWVALVCGGLVFLVAVTLVFIAIRWTIKRWSDISDNVCEPYPFFVVLFLLVISGFALNTSLNGALKLANPHYYAAKELVDAAGGK